MFVDSNVILFVILCDRYRERYWKKEYFEAVKILKQVCQPHGLTMIQVAFDWLQFHSKLQVARGDGKDYSGLDGRTIKSSYHDITFD